MTDDEIDAAIAAVTAIQPDNRDRAIFRAGMREAAKIARNERPGYDVTDHYAHAIIEITALCIEREAAE
jgi:hypothetical protein